MLELNAVHQGDCLDLMKEIPDGSIDCIICDLPYGSTACAWDTIIPFEPLWEAYKRIIKKNGAIVLTASQPFTSMLVMSNIRWFKYEWIWEKSPTGFLNAKLMPMKNTESVLVFADGMPRYNPQGLVDIDEPRTNGTRSKSTHNGGKLSGNYKQSATNYPRQLIKCSSVTGEHPTQKPVSLFSYLVRTYTNEGDLVLDNCAGSGTLGVSCINTNRNFILIEQEPDYCAIARRRIKEAMSQGKLDLGGRGKINKIDRGILLTHME